MATTPTAAATPSAINKEKKNWFSSLTRRKKSQSHQNLNYKNSLNNLSNDTATLNANDTIRSDNRRDDDGTTIRVGPPTSISVGNDLALIPSNRSDGQEQSLITINLDPCGGTGATRKRKDEKNVFQRIRKKVVSSLRLKHSENKIDLNGESGTQDASNEFLTHSPIREQKLVFNFPKNINCGLQNLSQTREEPDLPFTYSYKRFIVKKWLDNNGNRVMYKACSEMLNQVWYWGEISRRDAQKQLTDKPTGSFLVRDSETCGPHYTLSFRILNVTLHYRLEYRDNYWHFEELQYESIVEMIEDILYRCTNDNFVCYVKVPNEMQPPFPVILKYPLSRYLKMPTLQDLCRRVIQKNSSMDEISKLPIPSKLLDYLSEIKELVFQS